MGWGAGGSAPALGCASPSGGRYRLMRVMHRVRAGNPPHPRCPLGQGGGSWRVAEVGAEGTVPGCPQSMGLLCRTPVPPGASWDPSRVVEATGSSEPGDALNPLPAAPRQSNGHSLGGPGRRGPQQEVTAGLSSLTPWLPARPAVLPREPVGGQQLWGRGASPGVMVAPHGRAPLGLAAG